MGKKSGRSMGDNVIRDAVANYLGQQTTSVHAEVAAASILPTLDAESFAIKTLLHKALTDELRKQTHPPPPPRDKSGQLFSEGRMARWIGAADGGRIKYAFARWPDHDAYREAEIQSMRAAANNFDEEERAREELARLGLKDNPALRTIDVVR